MLHTASRALASGAVVLAMLSGDVSSRQVSPGDQDIADAYVYLLGRALVVRQEHTDVAAGARYNEIVYNPLGSADFVNPNLDVAYLEAWIAVDERTPVLLEVPAIKGRYYTAQILDEWGEVITNINERTYPTHPSGKFALVLPGSTVTIPRDIVRIELHSRKAKLLGRVELKDDPSGAVALQKQFRLSPLGSPVVAPAPALSNFNNKDLIGVELFDRASDLIASAHDVSPLAAQLQARVRDVTRLAADPATRQQLETTLRQRVIPEFLEYAVTRSGVFQNRWLGTIGTGNYGADYRRRTAANQVGLWANTNDEVVYFVGTQDADGEPLTGAHDYVIEFPAASRPETVVDAYWSVILVDLPDYRVVPNDRQRYNFNNYSGLVSNADGSLTILLAASHRPPVPESNWLPSPAGKRFSLNLRTYVPKDVVKRGQWFPPAIRRVR